MQNWKQTTKKKTHNGIWKCSISELLVRGKYSILYHIQALEWRGRKIENRYKSVYSIISEDFHWYFNVLMLRSLRSSQQQRKNIFIEKVSERFQIKAIECREWPVLWRARKISFIPRAKHLYLSSHDLNSSRAEEKEEISLPFSLITGHNTSNQITMKFTRTIERMLIQSGLQFFTFMILAGMWFLCAVIWCVS